jgi:hypothetical protein
MKTLWQSALLFCCALILGGATACSPGRTQSSPIASKDDVDTPAIHPLPVRLPRNSNNPQAASGLPTPPSTAVVFTQIEQLSGWNSCDNAACAGGSGTGAYWMTQNQTSPSLTGSSMELFNSGAWANALWWQKMGAQDSASNFVWDFYVQVDESSVSAAQALEFDSFQFYGGYNYMFGSQCDFGNGKWDVWDEANGRWLPTTVACKSFEPGTWHHIQWYITDNKSARTYTFMTLVVDGVPYVLNLTYGAKNVGWSDEVGVQYQLDVNATGNGYHEWVDDSNLTVW